MKAEHRHDAAARAWWRRAVGAWRKHVWGEGGVGVDDDAAIVDDLDPVATDVHEWFELSYAQYLTIPRSVLQSMPEDWQARFARCLSELDHTIDWRPRVGRYWVQLRDEHGRYVRDDLADYERGRRRILPRPFKETP